MILLMKIFQTYKFHVFITSSVFLLISSISNAIANPVKYICTGDTNNLYVIFNTKQKQVITGNNNPKKYWTDPNFRYWHSAKEYLVYEYTFNYSYNKLSGNLEVKSHNMVTSENKWYYYKCVINQ